MVLPLDGFHEIVADPPKMAKFVNGASFLEATERYHHSVKVSRLMGKLEFTMKRWACITFCLGWAFTETFLDPNYYGK